jgi:nicotinamidase-related amidase
MTTAVPRPALSDLVAPAHTAVVTMELQRGIVGDLAMMGALRQAALERGTFDGVARLARAAHGAGVRLVHCTAEHRPDNAGSAANCRMLAMSAKAGPDTALTIGSERVELIPELELDPARDIVVPRMHGMTPFMSTSLDQILRNLGVRTVVAAGVSVNIGVLGLVMSAVDLGYQVVLPLDAVAGIPNDYAEQVIEHSLQYLATLTSVTDLEAAWK